MGHIDASCGGVILTAKTRIAGKRCLQITMICLCVSAVGLGNTSLAQPQGMNGLGVGSKKPLDEIVVLTTRRGAKVADVPSNISSIDGTDIRFQASDHISEILNRLPGLNVQRGSGQEHLTAIRSPVLTGGAGAGSFLYLEDGVPLRAAGFANVNGLFEAHTELAGGVEVVRGPGSALYGSNAVHGLINVLTPSPSTDRGGQIDLSWGRYGRGQMNASLSGGDGQFGAFAGLTLTNENGYRQNAGLDQQKATLRTDWDGGNQRLRLTLAGHNLNQETAGFIEGPDAYKDSTLARSNPNPEAFRDTRALRASMRYEHDLTDQLVLSITPYARWNEMDFLLHFLPSKALEENGHKSFGALNTLDWTFGEHRLIVGADIEWSDGFLRETQSIPDVFSFVQGVHYDYEVESWVGALYAHGEWQATDALRLIAGLRAEATEYDYDNKIAADTFGRFIRPADRNDDFFTLTPKFGLTYRINDNNMIFANYARGGRAPQTTDAYRLQLSQEVGEVEEEKLDSIEIGARGAVAGFNYQVTAYAMKKDNFFFRDSDGFNVTDGKTNHWGLEADLGKELGKWFAVNVGAAYSRNVYDFDNVASGVVDGNDVDTAPRLTANARLIWTPTNNVRAELEWVHMGEYYTDPANANRYPGHDLLNLRTDWQITENLSVFGAVRNLTNTDYAERADFAFGSERYFPGEERAAEIGVRASF